MRVMMAVAIGLCVGVAGCGRPEAPAGTETSAATGNAVATAPPSPPAVTPNLPALDGRLPASFRGRWGLVAADCEPGRDDAKGLMTVTADRLTFYESRATIAALERVSPDELSATLSFSGEGQTWTEVTPLILGDDGRTLTRRSAEGQTLRYTRCAGHG